MAVAGLPGGEAAWQGDRPKAAWVLVAQLSKPYGHSDADRRLQLQHDHALGITKTVLQQWCILTNQQLDSVEPPCPRAGRALTSPAQERRCRR